VPWSQVLELDLSQEDPMSALESTQEFAKAPKCSQKHQRPSKDFLKKTFFCDMALGLVHGRFLFVAPHECSSANSRAHETTMGVQLNFFFKNLLCHSAGSKASLVFTILIIC